MIKDTSTVKPKAKKKTTKGKNSTQKAKKINLKQQLFIDNYTNIDNPKTFGNGTQSVQAVYKYNSNQTATVQASRLLRKDNIASEIECIIDDLDMGAKVRLNAIKKVITGEYTQHTTSTSRDKEGNEYINTSERSPTASEILKAVDLTEKISGTYDKNRVKADVMSLELKELTKRHRAALQGTGGGGK